MSWVRLVFSRMLNALFKAVLRVPVRDLSSGFRLYRRGVVSAIAPTAKDFDILQEILTKAFAGGYRVREIPFQYHRRGSGSSHARLVAFGWQYLRTLLGMWKLRNSVLSGDYDLRAFDSNIPVQRWWQRRRYRIILGWAGGEVPALDVGCGSSRILGGLARGSLGIDPSIAKLRYARCHGRPLAVGALPALPVRSGAFRTLICSQVIEHIPRDEAIFEEFSRVLPAGGMLILGTPDYGRFAWRLTEFLYRHLIPGGYADEHITRYTRADLVQALRRHGFRPEEERYVGAGELIVRCRKG
jgi:SAM-dependent methyltransferase